MRWAWGEGDPRAVQERARLSVPACMGLRRKHSRGPTVRHWRCLDPLPRSSHAVKSSLGNSAAHGQVMKELSVQWTAHKARTAERRVSEEEDATCDALRALGL